MIIIMNINLALSQYSGIHFINLPIFVMKISLSKMNTFFHLHRIRR